MRLPDERYEEIKNIVVDLLIRLDISCTPIGGFEIAKKLGIIIVPYSAKKNKTKINQNFQGWILLRKRRWNNVYFLQR